jgi:hypothetical protein
VENMGHLTSLMRKLYKKFNFLNLFRVHRLLVCLVTNTCDESPAITKPEILIQKSRRLLSGQFDILIGFNSI